MFDFRRICHAVRKTKTLLCDCFEKPTIVDGHHVRTFRGPGLGDGESTIEKTLRVSQEVSGEDYIFQLL